ncbi:PAAR domain-containing protein, partial [Pseudomonas weihenstephanensis]
MKDIIRLGDSTTHGGVVLEAFSRTDLNGKPIAGVGHNVSCPL